MYTLATFKRCFFSLWPTKTILFGDSNLVRSAVIRLTVEEKYPPLSIEASSESGWWVHAFHVWFVDSLYHTVLKNGTSMRNATMYLY